MKVCLQDDLIHMPCANSMATSKSAPSAPALQTSMPVRVGLFFGCDSTSASIVGCHLVWSSACLCLLVQSAGRLPHTLHDRRTPLALRRPTLESPFGGQQDEGHVATSSLICLGSRVDAQQSGVELNVAIRWKDIRQKTTYHGEMRPPNSLSSATWAKLSKAKMVEG